MRVLIGSGQLAPAWPHGAARRDAASVEGQLARRVRGVGQDALRQGLVEGARSLGRPELAEYARALPHEGVELWDQIVALGAPFIRSTAQDADMPASLELVVDTKTIHAGP